MTWKSFHQLPPLMLRDYSRHGAFHQHSPHATRFLIVIPQKHVTPVEEEGCSGATFLCCLILLIRHIPLLILPSWTQLNPLHSKSRMGREGGRGVIAFNQASLQLSMLKAINGIHLCVCRRTLLPNTAEIQRINQA